MPRLSRPSGHLLLMLSALFVLTAQLSARAQISPITDDPARALRPAAYQQAAAARRTTAVALPFFDDFADDRTGPQPNPILWDTTSGAARNETFARRPPSRGVVTFDGLNRFGRSYGSGSAGPTDTLTSQPIDLSGRTNVVLSFWWQAGGVNDSPPRGVHSLTLEFDDGSGVWDPTSFTQRGNNNPTAFAQVFVPVPAQYLTGNFRFRFRARGNQIGIINTWNLDYVELDANRQPQPGPVRDVAFSQTPTLPLKRFSAMPVWQFNAATTPADELADVVRTTINNLEPDSNAIPTPLTIRGWLTTRVGGVVTQTDNFLTENRNVRARLQIPLVTPLRPMLPAVPVAPTPDYKTLTTTLVLQTGEPTSATQYNDTLRRRAALRTYYAHDDGTPELAHNFGGATGPFAACIAFDLNAPDQVAGIELYIAGGAVANTQMYADVWADDPQRAGWPERTTPLAHVGFRVPTEADLRRTGRWFSVNFGTAVPVSGRFYVGYSIQVPAASIPATSVGYDVNDSVRAIGQLFRREFTDPWAFPAGIVPGWLMVRAKMNNNVVGLPAAAAPAAPLTVFPNPVSATGTAVLYLPTAGISSGSVTLLDALGRQVRTAPAGAETLSVRGLAPGVYGLRLEPAGSSRSIRVLVTE